MNETICHTNSLELCYRGNLAEPTFSCLTSVSTPTSIATGTDGETYRCPRMVAVNKYVRTHGNSCYQFITYERSWNSAQNDCRSRRGHLVTIRDRGTQDFIYRTLREFHWPGNGVWLGASDQQNEMDWKWVTSELITGLCFFLLLS